MSFWRGPLQCHVPRTCAHNATVPYVLAPAEERTRTPAADRRLRDWLNEHEGKVTNRPVAQGALLIRRIVASFGIVRLTIFNIPLLSSAG